MKSKFSILFILIISVLTAVSCMFAGAEAEVFSEAGLTYTVNSDSTATVTGFSGEAVTDLVIPESLGGYTVSAIGSLAFANCGVLESVSLPNGVSIIDSNAFDRCTSLKSINLNEGITELGVHAFLNCTSLTEITFPSTLIKVSDNGIFTGCDNLKKVIFAEGTVKVAGNVCNNAQAVTEVVLPESVTEIGYDAFNGCNSLKSICLPENIIEIGSSAFEGCESLVSINLPEGITVINSFVFSGCTSLKSINLHEGITEIGVHAFLNCTSLTEITFPSTLIKVSDYGIFTGCDNLKKVIFAEGTVKVADNVCNNVPAITGVVIPDTVRTIGNNAFEKCVNLKTIDLNKVETLGTYSFSECTELSAITLPETLKYTTGSSSPFNGCSNITSIIFEGSTIPANFCCNMDSLHTIDMKNGLTAVGEDAFSSVDNLRTFIIRDRNCSIPDTEEAIPSGATIYGYELSTAQEYAEKYERNFAVIESVDNYESAVNHVRRQMINRSKYIILSYPQSAPAITSNNDFVRFFDAVFAYDKADPAAGDHLRWSVKKINRAVLDDGYLVLDVDYYTTAEQENQLDDILSECIDSLQLKDKPEYEKARLIFGYLCDNANAISQDDREYNDVQHSAYSVLVDNSGVCEGFSLAFYRLALEAGLDARVVVSDKLLHACNIVKIADQWYYLDTYLAADEDDSSRGDVFYFLKSAVESQFIGEDYIAFTPDYETEEKWALTPKEIKGYSFSENDYIVDGGCSHILEFIGYAGKPCSGTGKEEYKCPKCGNEFSRNCSLEHSAVPGSIRCQWCNKNLCKHEEQYRTPVPERKAACTEDGLTAYEYCSRCKEHNFSNPELIPATGHSDKDNDGVCDQCGTTVGKKENAFVAAIKKFFGKINTFLAKLFKWFRR